MILGTLHSHASRSGTKKRSKPGMGSPRSIAASRFSSSAAPSSALPDGETAPAAAAAAAAAASAAAYAASAAAASAPSAEMGAATGNGGSPCSDMAPSTSAPDPLFFNSSAAAGHGCAQERLSKQARAHGTGRMGVLVAAHRWQPPQVHPIRTAAACSPPAVRNHKRACVQNCERTYDVSARLPQRCLLLGSLPQNLLQRTRDEDMHSAHF